MQVLAVCGEDDWQDLERIFIGEGEGLTNMTPGGEGIPPELVSAARAGTYIVTYPDGTEETITNLSKFCKERGIPNGNAFQAVRGERYHAHGYRFRNVGEPPRELPPTHLVERPDGTQEYVRNLSQWARDKGFSAQSCRAVASGQKPHYRGIKITSLKKAGLV